MQRMALKTQFPLFAPPQLLPHPHRPTTEIRFSRWNNANAQKFIRRERSQKELEDQHRLEKRFDSALTIAHNYNPAPPHPTIFKSTGTPSEPSSPSIPGKASKYSRNPSRNPSFHPAFKPLVKTRNLPIEQNDETPQKPDFRIDENGIAYEMPEAPFLYQYSYTETPKVKPLKLREPLMSPFGPDTMAKPWLGRKPLPPSKKKLPEFDSFQLPPPHKKGVKPVQKPGPFLPGSGPKYVRSRIAMATHLQSSSPNKRPKTLSANSPSPPSSISKGKSKVNEEPPPPIAETESPDCCGICLSEAGASRGHIDCCDHYYCFVCIMEWAKVESKCPYCKRRFSTIRRPPKPPLFASERVVQIPIRDQVFHYLGNATIGPSNMYSEAKCSICLGTADESLLLLCDLCDSSAHTYCVDLGYTVPEGDWFCQDCTLLRDEHLKSESNNDSDVQMSSSVHQISTNVGFSVSGIMRECRGQGVPINNIRRPSSTSLEIIVQHQSNPNARTLRHCRNLHDRIRAIRQNWNGLRNGALRFSSNPGEGNLSQNCATPRREESSVPCLLQQPIAQSSSDIKNDSRDNEIQKAWEMFDIAKAIRQDRERSNIELCKIRKLNPIRSANYVSNRQVSLSQPNGAKNVRSMGETSSSFGKAMSKLHVAKDVTYCREGSVIGHSSADQELRSSKETISHPQPVTKTFKGPQCLGSDALGPVISNIDQVKGVNHASSSHSKVKHTKEKRESEKIYVDIQQYNDAKSEIQSLVKLNLKIQTKEEKLEVDAFKEVARIATHSILAACGLEHPRPGFSSIPGNNCSHDIRRHQKSSLMSSSCRECFYVFVKDVVSSVVLQNKRTQKNS